MQNIIQAKNLIYLSDFFPFVNNYFSFFVMGEFHVQKVGEDGRTEIPAMAFWHRCIA